MKTQQILIVLALFISFSSVAQIKIPNKNVRTKESVNTKTDLRVKTITTLKESRNLLRPSLKRPDTQGLSVKEATYHKKLHRLVVELDKNLAECLRLEEQNKELNEEMQTIRAKIKKTNVNLRQEKLKTRLNQLDNKYDNLNIQREDCHQDSEMLQISLKETINQREQNIQLTTNMINSIYRSLKVLDRW
ncbi:hypothetical protein [Flavobacterium sp. CS20]|uniref:hypothetical protein n=1 Tax=Flavobacterium sp. CS20 TaxID=2775246 RepID=UPI001B3A34BE|nr:hypothetical protein [Flavobacterium sp. CS20]QTY28206.1 hypothetical protein IGB25_06960 [Flavobacterium sp. CS20]